MTLGKLIVIEGSDCSGKHTQTEMLVERLASEGISCKTMSFPRYDTPTGRIVGECYLGKNSASWFRDANSVHPLIASLYYAADRFAAVSDILDVLASGTHLVLDRYVESNLAHQGGKERNPNKRLGLIKKISDIEYRILEIPKPDAIIFLHMPYLVSIELKKGRQGKADSHESNPEHLKNTEETYLQLANMFKWIRIDCAPDCSDYARIRRINNSDYPLVQGKAVNNLFIFLLFFSDFLFASSTRTLR